MISEKQKFWARVCTFDNKRSTPEKRKAIACKAVRFFLWHLTPEPARKGVEAVELLALGTPEKKQAKKALREARKAHRAYFPESELRAGVPDSVIGASSCADVTTFTPFNWNDFYNLFERTAEVLRAEAQELGFLSKDKREIAQFKDTVYVRFNEFIEPLVDYSQEFKDKAPSKVRQNLKYFSPLFHHTAFCADAEREWVYFNLFENTKRQMIFDTLDAWDAAAVASRLSRSDLEPILEIAKHANLHPRGIGLSLLILLAQVHEAAREALLSLLDSKRGVTRWQCITHIDYYRMKDLPPDFIEQIIRKGFEDRLPQSRKAAANLMLRYQRKDLLSLLEAKLAVERDGSTVKSFQFVIPLIRDGYFVTEEAAGELRLTSWTPYSVGSQPISKEDATPEKIKKIIAEKWASEEKHMGHLFRAGN